MIKNIIFDFGDIFIDLDKPATGNDFLKLGLKAPVEEIKKIDQAFEVGDLSTDAFIQSYQEWLPNAHEDQIVAAWNSIIKEFPMKRLEFLQQLQAEGNYRIFLLSNTNDLHIEYIKEQVPFYENFKDCFEQFYLSQEIGLRKPNANIYEFVLEMNSLKPSETLFIDDTKANTDTAAKLGIHIWNLIPGKEDITELFTLKANLF